MFQSLRSALISRLITFGLAVLTVSSTAWGQDRLASMPGAAQYKAARGLAVAAGPTLARANGSWTSNDTYSFVFRGTQYVYDAKSNSVTTSGGTASEPPETEEIASLAGPHQQPARGRQFAQTKANDGKTATYSEGNITLTTKDGKSVPITTDGSISGRIKYGTASWVYGEELEQKDAMGFSADGRFLWYFRFDERKVPDYYVLTGMRQPQDGLAVEAYPKPGKPNPVVDLFVYDTVKRATQKVEVRPGAFDDQIGHYIYGVFWNPARNVLYFHRMNRRQNVVELCSFDPATAKVGVLDREEEERGWVDLGPRNTLVPNPWVLGPETMLTLSEKSGFFNLIAINMVTGGRVPLTDFTGDIVEILPSASPAGMGSGSIEIDCMVMDGNQPYRAQLHRVVIDARLKVTETKLTDSEFGHRVQFSPDHKLIVDEYQTATKPPALRVLDGQGRVLRELFQSDIQPYLKAGFHPAEPFSFTSKPNAQGKTETVYGYLSKPKGFDPAKKYPVLLDVYGGPLLPSWGHPANTWRTSSPTSDYGFLMVTVLGRGEQARGKEFRQSFFHDLGGPEIDDFASAVVELAKRPYVDSQRVGIFGTSYGGYASAMAILRYPDVFQAASCSSMVSDWRNYDTGYTERYMGLLPGDEKFYEKSSTLTYAKNLKGWMMLYFATGDDNTHMANTMQLANALRAAGKSFELQVGVDQGHSGLNFDRMMEFFIERLVMIPPRH